MPAIVDGHVGEPHIDPDDMRVWVASLIGSGVYRTSVGSQCAVTLADTNTLVVADGEIVAQGTRVRVRKAEEVKIANGVNGMNRIDLLLLHYEIDQETNLESTSWKIAQGVATTGTPTDPDYIEGDVLDGATIAEWPIARVTFAGLVPSEPEMLADVYRPYPELWESQSQIFRIEAGGKNYSIPANTADGLDVPIPVIDGYSPVSINEWSPNNNSVSTLRLSVVDSYVRVTLRNYTAYAQAGSYVVKVLYLRDAAAS